MSHALKEAVTGLRCDRFPLGMLDDFKSPGASTIAILEGNLQPENERRSPLPSRASRVVRSRLNTQNRFVIVSAPLASAGAAEAWFVERWSVIPRSLAAQQTRRQVASVGASAIHAGDFFAGDNVPNG